MLKRLINNQKKRRLQSPFKRRQIKKRNFELSSFWVQNIVGTSNGGAEGSRTPVQKASHVQTSTA